MHNMCISICIYIYLHLHIQTYTWLCLNNIIDANIVVCFQHVSFRVQAQSWRLPTKTSLIHFPNNLDINRRTPVSYRLLHHVAVGNPMINLVILFLAPHYITQSHIDCYRLSKIIDIFMCYRCFTFQCIIAYRCVTFCSIQ